MHPKTEEILSRGNASCDRAYNSWLSKATTAMVLSDIPEHEKLLPLIREAFNEGHASGQVFALVELIFPRG